MEELIKKIYVEIISYEKDVLRTGAELDQEVVNLIKPYQEELDEKSLEIVKTLMYQAILVAEQTGFWHGTKYAVKLMMKILSD